MTIKNFILKDGLLYLKGFVFTHEPIEQFVQNLIDVYVNEYDTYSCRTNQLQCSAEKHRSFGDLYCICKYYYPSLSPKILKKILNLKYETGLIRSLNCYNINKVTYFTQRAYFNKGYASWRTYKNEYKMFWNDFNFNRRFTGTIIPISNKPYNR